MQGIADGGDQRLELAGRDREGAQPGRLEEVAVAAQRREPQRVLARGQQVQRAAQRPRADERALVP
jgi:hypothetical protein